MAAYYNEHDPKAAAWLRELIKGGHIAPGDVDERSICDVQPSDLSGYTQCHFFAGIGGWSLALRLTGWADERPVWTGSCPCQPFSSAGKGLGAADERHLWPAFMRLIRERRPLCVFGEQVEAAVGHGWLDGVSADLEAENYTCGAAVLGAHSVGAPHIRQRLYWMAYTSDARQNSSWAGHKGQGRPAGLLSVCGANGGLEHSESDGRQQRRAESGGRGIACGCGSCGMGEPESEQARLPRFPWGQSDTVDCADGKARRIESGTFPLAHGVSGRVGLLRGYGNAIVPQVAAHFIQACEGAISDLAA